MTRHRPAALPEAIACLPDGAAANPAATERIWVLWLSDGSQVSRTGILIDMITRKIVTRRADAQALADCIADQELAS
jgi:hypothetical protein